MHTFVELWSCKPAWIELSSADRGAYMERIAPRIEAVTRAGVELVAGGVADLEIDCAAGHDFFAVWSAPDAETARLLEREIAAADWYRYFEQVNVHGETLDLERLIETLTSAPRAAAEPLG